MKGDLPNIVQPLGEELAFHDWLPTDLLSQKLHQSKWGIFRVRNSERED
jgi:hypothetical protein